MSQFNIDMLAHAIQEVGEMTDPTVDLWHQQYDLLKATGLSHESAVEDMSHSAEIAKIERSQRLAEHHRGILRDAWQLVLADNGKYYDVEMRYIAKYMLDVVLSSNPLQMLTPEMWEQKYRLVTRQVDIGNSAFGSSPMWTGACGVAAEMPMKPLFCGKRKVSFASGYNIQIRGNRAVIVAEMESGKFNIHGPLGWQLAKSSMSFPVEWLYPTAINGIMRGMKWHRISNNSDFKARFATHITDKSMSKPGNPHKSVDILSCGMFLPKLWTIVNNKAMFKGFMDSRAGGGFTCMDVAYRYGKNDEAKQANGERPSIEIIQRDVLSVENSQKKHDKLLEIGARTEQFKLFHAFPQKPELTLEGAWQCDGKDNIYIIRNSANGVWWTNQQKNGSPTVNKVCARNDKLIIGGRKVAPLGKMAILVLKDVPKELEKLFVLGNFLMDEHQVKRIGIARCLTKNGNIKGVGLPWNLQRLGLQAICAKSSWKSDGNGVLAMHRDGISKEEQLEMSVEAFKDCKSIDDLPKDEHGVINLVDMVELAAHNKKVLETNVTGLNDALKDKLDALPTIKLKLPGVKKHMPAIEVEGWVVFDEVYASNLYCTYGVRQVGEIANDGTDEEQEQNGFFTEALLGLIANPCTYSPVQALIDGIKAKKYMIKKPVTQIKATDFMCVSKSYGVKVAKDLIDAAIENYMGAKGTSKRKVIQDIMLRGYGDVPTVEMDIFKTICPMIYVGPRGEPLSPSAANFNQVDRYDLTNERWSLLVDGSEQLGWPGLRHPNGMIIKQGNLSFYVPPWSVFDKDLDEDTVKDADGIQRIVRYLGDSWTQLVVLMKAAYSPQTKYEKNTDWVLSHANYMARMNGLILEDVMSKIDVKGRYYTILPKWWSDKANEVVCTDPMWHLKGKEIAQVLYMKNPALFGNPIVNMLLSKILPRDWITFDKAMMMALRSAIFVDTEFMLSRQDDCDGDQSVIMDLGGILPEDHDDKKSHLTWCANYIADEKKLAVGIKGYVPIDLNDMHDGIIKSAEGKRDTGVMTQNFFNVMLYLDRYGYQTKDANWDTIRLIIEAYATGVQDEAVRQIKQDSSSATFFKDAALSANPKRPMYNEERTKRGPDGQPETYIVEGRANLAAYAIHTRIQKEFGLVIDAKFVLFIVARMMLAQEYDSALKGSKVTKKPEAFYSLTCRENKALNAAIMANRIACLFTGSYWKYTDDTCPQWDALNSTRAAEHYELVQRLSVKTGNPAKDAENYKYLSNWINKYPSNAEFAYKHHWARTFKECEHTRAGWYTYHTWITAHGTDVTQWNDSLFGYMLSSLKDAFEVNPPKRPTGEKTVVKPIQVSQEHSAGVDALFAEMEAAIVVDNYDINVENIKKFAAMYHCKLELSATHVVINGELLNNNDVRAYSVENLRGVLRSLVAKLGLSREVPVVTYPTVFRTKDNDLLGVGSYVLHNKLNYMVYGFTKTGKAKLVGLMTDESLKVKAAGVEAAELVVKANFPMVDGLMIVKPTLAIDSKGKFVQPTDEQLKAAYLICNS